MTKVLFIAYYYPPLGGGGVPRTLYFVKYLPEFGYCPIVLTGPDVQSSDHYWQTVDRTLIKKTGEDVDIYRVSSQPPGRESTFKRRIRRILSLPDAFSSWWCRFAVEKAEQILQQKNYHLIYATMSPYASANIAAYLSRKYGIPWVADLRDPWALDELEIFPSIVHRRVGLWQMQKVLKTASAVIMNTSEAEKKLKTTFPIFQRIRTTVITNGYEPSDFVGEFKDDKKKKFRIVHSGYFHTDLGLSMKKKKFFHKFLRGHLPGLNIFTGSPYFLIKALEHWVSTSLDVLDNVEVFFLGKMSDADLQLIRQSSIASKLICTPGYVAHAENIRHLKSADLLFLAMHDLPYGDRATTVHGKTYEYMASGTPILAAVPEGDAKDILSNSGTAFICKPDDWKRMTEIMMQVYNTWKKGQYMVTPNNQFIEKFDRKVLTGNLASLFKEVSA